MDQMKMLNTKQLLRLFIINTKMGLLKVVQLFHKIMFNKRALPTPLKRIQKEI